MVLNVQTQDHRDRYPATGHDEADAHVPNPSQNSAEVVSYLVPRGWLPQLLFDHQLEG